MRIEPLSKRIADHAEHQRWRAWQKGQSEGPHDACYKDCAFCPYRDDMETPEEKEEFCEEQCPFDAFPVGPDREFILAGLWSRMPDGVIGAFANQLSPRLLMAITEFREYREAQRWGGVVGGGRNPQPGN